jgi:hypothetical protein
MENSYRRFAETIKTVGGWVMIKVDQGLCTQGYKCYHLIERKYASRPTQYLCSKQIWLMVDAAGQVYPRQGRSLCPGKETNPIEAFKKG